MKILVIQADIAWSCAFVVTEEEYAAEEHGQYAEHRILEEFDEEFDAYEYASDYNQCI